MRAKIGPGAKERMNKRPGNGLADGSGGTIAGGSMQPLDLMALLTGGAASVSVGGPVSGAAQAVQPTARAARGRDAHGPDNSVALSDGSRIVFVSVSDREILVGTGSRSTRVRSGGSILCSANNREWGQRCLRISWSISTKARVRPCGWRSRRTLRGATERI